MEHLPLLSGMVAPIVIPFVCKEEYDGGDFSSYPTRQNWKIHLWPGTFKYYGKRDLDEIPPFLQTWLFFGILGIVTGQRVLVQDFIRDEGGKQYITTAALQSYAENWKGRDGVLSGLEKQTRWTIVTATIAKSADFVDSLKPYFKEENQSPEFASALMEVLFGIDLLLYALLNAKIRIFRGEQWFGTSIRRNPLLRLRMTQAGWCPFAVSLMESDLELDAQAYAFAVGSIRTREDHSPCSSRFCKVNQLSKSYRVKHFTTNCRCSSFGPTIEQVCDVLRQGGIPLIKITTQQPPSNYELQVVASDTDISYTAISHVWSDGLGNPLSNTLPHCQIQNIENGLRDLTLSEPTHETREAYAKSTDEARYFWLDTFCIPVQAEHQDLRDLAISRMTATYENATSCLVLDADLQQMPKSTRLMDIMLKVITSVWRQRLWTLQEGALTTNLFIKGKDCVFNLTQMRRQFYLDKGDRSSAPWEPIHCQLTQALTIRIVRSVSVHRLLEDRMEYTIQRFIAAIANRITSRTGDETICIATFLGINPQPLLMIPDVDRMKVLFTLLPVIPATILFARAPRLSSEGFRWAPSTLLAPYGVDNHIIDGDVPYDLDHPEKLQPRPAPYLHPKGLVVCFPGIQLVRPQAPSPGVFFVYTSNHYIWRVEAFEPFNRESSWQMIEPSQLEHSAILLSDFTTEDMIYAKALLVSLHGKTPEGHLVAKSLTLIVISRYDLITRDERIDEPKRRIEGVWMCPQTWCVD